MQVQGFARHYAEITDEELLRLALVPDQLTDDANLALNAELSARGLGKPEHLARFHTQEEERKREVARQTGQFFLIAPYGIGRMRFGRAARRFDSESGLEEFTTTVFTVLLWMPLIPTGTYRVLGKRGFRPRKIHVMEKLPLDWAQVGRVWAAALVGATVFLVAFSFLLRF